MRKLFIIALLSPFFSNAQVLRTEAIFPFLDIRPVLDLSVVPKGNALFFEPKKDRDFLTGMSQKNAFSVEIKSNTNWQLTINSDAETFTNQATSMPSEISSEIIQIRQDKKTQYVALNTTPQVLAIGGPGGSKSKENNFDLDLALLPGDYMESGGFQITLFFTLSSQ
ncbi:hypothetical protein [Jiulongibacter sediminis]|uniref:hypothetical protein n=1 Tax=Jiulongibacter sediminis TaxID=1605367 RepID=UPI0026EF74B6|nr:hypothetical protein [Jiulongibacter sediminis]